MLTEIPDQAGWIVFVLVLANQAGVPVFAAPALLGVGVLAADGDPSVGVAVTVAVAAALCADLAWYGLGRWRGSWALAALGRLSGRTGLFMDEARRLFLAHDRAAQLGARFLPELNPLAAALAGAAGISLKRFVVSAIVSAAVWAGTWIGAGYAVADAWNEGESGIPFFIAIVAGSMVATLTVMIRLGRQGIAAIARARRERIDASSAAVPRRTSTRGAVRG
jgi:membrane protein DedA with SNARE-associated domain